MKKSFILIILLLPSLLLSCLRIQESEKKFEVLEVRLEQYENTPIIHHNDISETIKVSTNTSNKSFTKKMFFSGKELQLEYKDTYTYITRSETLERYEIVNSENKDACVMVTKEGKIFSILGETVCILDIEKTASVDEVKQAVIQALGSSIDFAKYEYCDGVESLPDITNGFGLYTYCWYNKLGDVIVGDYVSLCVNHDGEISGLNMNYNAEHNFNNMKNEIFLKDYTASIAEKLQDIYSSNSCKLSDYNIKTAILCEYNNNYYIDCVVSVHYIDAEGSEWSEACQLMVKIN